MERLHLIAHRLDLETTPEGLESRSDPLNPLETLQGMSGEKLIFKLSLMRFGTGEQGALETKTIQKEE